MPKSPQDLILAQQENTGHALDVARWKANEVPRKPGRQHAENAFRVQILAPAGAHQAERQIEPSFDVTKPWLFGHAVIRKETPRLFLIGQMNKCEPQPFLFNTSTFLGQLGDRLAAERSTKVAEKNQQYRRLCGEPSQGLTGLRTIRIQKRGIDAFRTRHAHSLGCEGKA